MQIDAGTDPFTLFQSWYDEAVASEINDPDAMALASVDADGMPSVRMVLLKEWSDEGFVFYTNYESRKSGELLGTGKAAFCMHWKSLRRQVRVVGPVSQVPAERSDAYFATRGRGSRIGAWASAQSRPLDRARRSPPRWRIPRPASPTMCRARRTGADSSSRRRRSSSGPMASIGFTTASASPAVTPAAGTSSA